MGYHTQKTTTAHPRSKIIPCPFCRHPNCTRHGNYSRKGTRPLGPYQTTEVILVPRFLCRPCGATHSILPENLLPICRWFLGDVAAIAASLVQGKTLYAIAKRIGESLACIRNLKAWIDRAGAAILYLTFGAGHMDSQPQRPTPTTSVSMLNLARLWPSWRKFTHSFSRAFYPSRFPVSPAHTILTG